MPTSRKKTTGKTAKGKAQPPPKRGRGKPKFTPTPHDRAYVRWAAIAGHKQEDICRAIANPHTGKSIDAKTLRLHFRDELDRGEMDTSVMIVDGLMKKVKAGDSRILIFLAKTRLGWKTTEVREHTGTNGGPINVEHKIDLRKLSADERANVRAILSRRSEQS